MTDKRIFNSLFQLSLLITADYTIESVACDHVSAGERRMPSHFCRIKQNFALINVFSIIKYGVFCVCVIIAVVSFAGESSGL